MDWIERTLVCVFIALMVGKFIHWIYIDKKRKNEMQAGMIEYLKPSVRSSILIWRCTGCHADINVPDGSFSTLDCNYCGTHFKGYSLMDLLHYNRNLLPIESSGWMSVVEGLDKYEIEKLRNRYNGF